MSDQGMSEAQMRGFRSAVESLKLYRRADLHDPEQGSPLIEELYVDPLPHEDVFRTAVRPHTTFVIGRKGTGKSTIFQRLQHELRKGGASTSAYLDIKTIFESSQPDQALVGRLEARKDALPREAIEKLTLYREFLKATVTQVQEELKRRITSSIWERIKESFTQTYAELFDELDSLLDSASEDNFVSVLGILETQLKDTAASGGSFEKESGMSANFSETPSITVSATEKLARTTSNERESVYGDILIRAFNIKAFLDRLKNLLSKIGIRHLYILVDDFSELPEEAMRVVVDALIAPLNNWSDEFVKFKIAAYPGRIYYGAIDKTKVDEIHLDLYSLFGTSDVSTMETNAAAFTRRLVESRLTHFTKQDSSAFFDTKNDEVWRVLFYASMANPRTLGYVLHFAYQNQLIHGKKIGVQSIQDASLKYYEEKIASYFSAGRFLHESFSERCSIFSLKELLEILVTRSKELRTHKSAVFEKIAGRPPTSHFHVVPSYDGLLSTLELNFFITKYFEMSDRGGKKVSVYALNYGLCQRYAISFGRPSGEREFRLYFVERVFDYSPFVSAFIAKNQEIVCSNCGEKHGLDRLDALRLFGMKCPKCQVGVCEVVNLSKKYESVLKSVQSELLLPKTELGILQALHAEGNAQRPAYIAAELDCSYQLVGKRAVRLEDRGLVTRTKDDSNNRLIQITDTAEATYFVGDHSGELDVGSDS